MTTAIVEPREGVLVLIDKDGDVAAASIFRLGVPESLNRAVAFVNDGRRSNDRVRRYIDGENVVLGRPAPETIRPYREGDCDLCDGWHPLGDHGSSNGRSTDA